MGRLGAKLVRYSAIVIIAVAVALSLLGTLLSIYDAVEVLIAWLPSLPVESLTDLLTDPVGILLGSLIAIGTIIIGRSKSGDIAEVLVSSLKSIDSVLGWSLFDEPDLVGRIKHDDVAWRFRYWEGGRVEFVQRECPICGLKLVSRYLPRDIVHGPNTGFDPGEESRETSAEAWENVFGREKTEDRGETSAMACPECNFSIPGEPEIAEGKDGASSKFRKHVDQMQSGDARGELFAQYVSKARNHIAGPPMPSDIWDAYVQTEAPDNALPIGGPSDQSQRNSTETIDEEMSSFDEEAAGGSNHA
jgi:hypothetical protein